jgi:C-terminal processing protease CtpA/Prc
MKDEPPYSMFVWSVIEGWQGHEEGILADDVLIQINDEELDYLDFDVVMEKLLTSPRPMTLKVQREIFTEIFTGDKDIENNNLGEVSEDLTIKDNELPKLPPRKIGKADELMQPMVTDEVVPS